jgi:hypothetical protein
MVGLRARYGRGGRCKRHTRSVKFIGSLNFYKAMVGQEHYVCDDTAPEAIVSRAVEAWCCRETIRAELMITVDATKKLALHNAQLVADLLKQRGSGSAAV